MSAVNAFVAPNRPAPRLDAVPARGAPRLAAREEAAPISVECASGARLLEIASAWRDLVGRAHEPNVFMDPTLIEVAERQLSRRSATLLAWRGEALVGLWAFSLGAPALLPARMLSAPAIPYGYLATPVIDRAGDEETLEAMLDFIARDPGLPKTIALDPIRLDGPTMQALVRVLQARASAPFVLSQARRPTLESELDGKQYFEKALSSASRKKLRQHRRRLEEKGKLELKVWNTPEAVGQAFEDFLRLEAAGWKGRRGTALLCDQAEAAFVRGMVAALAERGNAAVHALYLDGKPVSMQIVLRAGPAAFTWKTAYDEALHDYSPGMLLLEDYTKAFLADDGIAYVDSCAYDETGFMSAWSERQTIAQVWIDARRGGSLGFRLLCRLQKAFLTLRTVAKEGYLSWRRKWKKH
jgi:CelD/BcsL family acetyltransferase involved in cellulose biosynthesis